MPAKRQAPPAGAAGEPAQKRPSVGASGNGSATATSSTAATGAKTYKYSTRKQLPDLISVTRPRDEEDSTPSETEEEVLEREAKNIRTVDDRTWPCSKAGFELFKEIDEEQRNRDPDRQNVYISNDWARYGMMEVFANHFAEFNKIVFKQETSLLTKWSYVEAVVLWIMIGDPYSLMMNDDSEGVTRTLDMFIPLLITAFEMLAEHDLVAETSAISNAGVVAQFAIKFLEIDAKDTGYKLPTVHEIVRAADTYGIVLTPRKEFGIDEKKIEGLRKKCKGVAKRGNWKTEYTKYKRNHPGGTEYDITKMSAARRKGYEYGGDSDAT